ncbi:hypothetical protein N8739_00635 [Luminiphilus sp.]|nr:hypothetical protein [Luminiphilus sp.]
MKLKLLIAVAALVSVSANAQPKREDYPSYNAYLAAMSAYTNAEMEKELKPEPALVKADKRAVDDYKKAGEAEFGDDDQMLEIDYEKGVVEYAHAFGETLKCKITYEGKDLARRELRDREVWTYRHGGPITSTITPTCSAEGSIAASEEKDGTRLVLKNLTSKPWVCRVRIEGKKTVDSALPPDIPRSFGKPQSSGWRWHCTPGTEYTGDLSKEPMGKEG